MELYPEHDDFAVRTSGLPGIGLARRDVRLPRRDGQPLGPRGLRLPLGHDAVARDGARVHARGDGPPRAALVQRRRLGIRGVAHGAARPAGTCRCRCSRRSRRTSSCPSRSSIAASFGRPTMTRCRSRTCRPGSSASTSRSAVRTGGARRNARPCTRQGKDTAAAIQAALGDFGRGVRRRSSRRTCKASSASCSRASTLGRKPSRPRTRASATRTWQDAVDAARARDRAVSRVRRRGQRRTREGARASRARAAELGDRDVAGVPAARRPRSRCVARARALRSATPGADADAIDVLRGSADGCAAAPGGACASSATGCSPRPAAPTR